jgi:thioredoxin 1
MSPLERSRQHERPVVVQFHATWCGPCKALSPHVDRMEQSYKGMVDVWRIDVDQNPAAAQEMGVRGVPTLVVLKDGQELSRVSGFQTPSALENLFATALPESGERPVPAWDEAPPASVGIERLRTPAAILGFGLLFASNARPWLHGLFWLAIPFIAWGMANSCPLCAVGTRGVGKLFGKRSGG